jgi:fructose-bisphosphate aldolase, class II
MLIHPKDLFSDCLKRNYMIAAFNVFNLDSATAVLEAAAKEYSPVILQISMGTRKYTASLPLFIDVLRLCTNNYNIPVILHHDHCPSVEASKEAIDMGIPSVMYDGSHLSFEENVESTREITDYAHKRGIWVEAELGSIPGFEDETFSDKAVFTDPEMAKAFVEKTNCDSLAIAVGTSHGGVLSEHSLKIDFMQLKKISRVLPGYPLVLHGGASLSKELIDSVNSQGAKVPYMRNVSETDIALCRNYGVVKVNMDVDNFMVYTTKVRETLNQRPDKYDPRIYLKEAKMAFEEQVRHKMKNVLNSAHMTEQYEKVTYD